MAIDSAAADDSHSMHIDRSASTIRLRGDASSTAHEVILRQTLREFFPDLTPDVSLTIRPGAPPGWSLLTDRVLRSLAAAETGSADIDRSVITIRVVTRDRLRTSDALEKIESAILPGMEFDTDIVEVSPAESFADLCRLRFDEATAGRTIDFPGSGAGLSPGAEPLLDALIEIAVDCPQATIRVTGHTDASGNEEANIALSLERAQAVVAYMRERGLPANRLEAIGAGSSQPLLAPTDPRARRINRRVEFELLLP